MRVRATYLAAHPFCQWYIAFNGLDEQDVLKHNGHALHRGEWHHVPRSDQIHHKRGRVGSLLTNAEFFMAVSSKGHTYIHDNPRESYAKGWMLTR